MVTEDEPHPLVGGAITVGPETFALAGRSPQVPEWGPIGAVLYPRIRDNSGHCWSVNALAEQVPSASITGHPTTPVLSRTEVFW
jgi:hypothetical protein